AVLVLGDEDGSAHGHRRIWHAGIVWNVRWRRNVGHAGCFPGGGPAGDSRRPSRRRQSLSLNRPTRRPPSTTGKQPTRCLSITSTACRTVQSLSAAMTFFVITSA